MGRERPVLQRVDGEAVEVAERRLSRAEVVDVDLHTQRPDAGDSGRGDLGLLHHGRLRDLDVEPGGVDRRGFEDPPDLVDEARLQELLRRQIDGKGYGLR